MNKLILSAAIAATVGTASYSFAEGAIESRVNKSSAIKSSTDNTFYGKVNVSVVNASSFNCCFCWSENCKSYPRAIIF